MPLLSDKHHGNALIVAIVLIALFIILTFGISTLILQSTVAITSVESAHKAFYASESGIEEALFSLKNHFPGFEETKEGALGTSPFATPYTYTIKARTNRIPAEGTNTLLPDQSVSLALYKDVGQGNVVTIENFNPATDIFELTYGGAVEGENGCIKWTIFGFRQTDMKTESMGNIYCSISQDLPDAYVSPVLHSLDASGIFKGLDMNTNPVETVHNFLLAHTQNYLVLSNITPGKNVQYTLSFQGNTYADQDFLITAAGKDRNFEQIEEAIVPQGDLFPAFHFAIFDPY